MFRPPNLAPSEPTICRRPVEQGWLGVEGAGITRAPAVADKPSELEGPLATCRYDIDGVDALTPRAGANQDVGSRAPRFVRI